MLKEAISTGETSPARTPESVVVNAYDDWLQRKVECARAAMRAGQGRPNEEVEAAFAASLTRVTHDVTDRV